MGWPSLWPAYDALALAVVPEQPALIVSQLVHLGSSLTVQLRWSTYSNIRRMTVNFAIAARPPELEPTNKKSHRFCPVGFSALVGRARVSRG